MSCQLLDSGNLVLTTDNGKSLLWQSFDHMTNTFLPGMKLGLDKKSGLNRYITSWRSKDDPSPGNFSFRVDPNGSPQFFLYQGSNPVWRTGPWVGQKWSGVPDMTRAYIFNYSFISDMKGTVQRRTWHENSKSWVQFWSAPKDDCDQYKPKSPRDWFLRDGSQGCVREENRSMCNNKEGFLKLASVKLPDTSKAWVNKSMTVKECEKECLKNCTCIGYTSADDSGKGSGCISLYGQLMDTRFYSSGGQDVHFRADTVMLGDVLTSKAGKFTLGFFSPGNSTTRYVGIWFTKVSVQTVVWVANRNNPINDFHGILSINRNGILHSHLRILPYGPLIFQIQSPETAAACPVSCLTQET
ncbi:hypothetical protein RDABS01_037696 [Bienertia sinuspersici]